MIELQQLQNHKTWPLKPLQEITLKKVYAILFYSMGIDIGRSPDDIFDESTFVDSSVKNESRFSHLDSPKPSNRNNLILLNILRKLDCFQMTTSQELHAHFNLVTDEMIKQYLPSRQINIENINPRKTKGPGDNYFTTVDSDNVQYLLHDYNIFELEKSLFLGCRNDLLDTPLLRYIVARRYSIGRALEMCFKSLDWRHNIHPVDSYLCKGDYGFYNSNPKLLSAFALYQAYLRGYDKAGRPIVVIDVGKHFRLDCSDIEFERFICIIIEQTKLRLQESQGINKGTILFDMSNFTLRNADLHAVRFLAGAFESNYPEHLGVILIHNAPWIFNTVWKIIRNWLDPSVASKIHFTYKIDDLETFIGRNYIPKSLGGDDTFKMTYVSPTSKNALKKQVDSHFDLLIYQRYELFALFIQSTIDWFNATSRTQSYNLLVQRLDLQKQLAQNYIELDPYVRSKGASERCGEVTELVI